MWPSSSKPCRSWQRGWPSSRWPRTAIPERRWCSPSSPTTSPNSPRTRCATAHSSPGASGPSRWSPPPPPTPTSSWAGRSSTASATRSSRPCVRGSVPAPWRWSRRYVVRSRPPTPDTGPACPPLPCPSAGTPAHDTGAPHRPGGSDNPGGPRPGTPDDRDVPPRCPRRPPSSRPPCHGPHADAPCAPATGNLGHGRCARHRDAGGATRHGGDVRHGAPHPPGYFLFVTAGRALHVVTGMSATASLVLVAALASAAAAACTVIAGADLGGRFVAGAAGTLMAASPVSWFNGSIAATYSFDALAAAGFTVLARRARPGSRHGVVAASAFGLAIGFRQSIAQLFGFLVVMAVAGSARSWRTIVGAALAGAGCLAAWFVPMVVVQPGGFAAWVRATHAEALGAYRTSSVLASTTKGLTSLGTMGAYALLLLGPVAVLGVGASVGLLALRLRRRRLPERPVSAGPESTSPPACPPASGPARALAAPRKRRAREPQLGAGPTPGPSARSEERRVGKE